MYDLHHGPNMTPMVDVVMVILIFFMASASLLGPEVLLRSQIDRPLSDSSEAVEPDNPAGADIYRIEAPSFTVELRVRDGAVTITGLGASDAPLSDIDAAAALLAERLGVVDDVRMVVTSSDDTPYEAIVRVIESLHSAGFDRVGVR